MNTHRHIGIVDLGISNLTSIRNSVSLLGFSESLIPCNLNSSSVKYEYFINECDALILPGVGSFPEGMKALVSSRADEFVVNFASSGKPLLGICLGMQLFATIGTENETCTKGLGFFNGSVNRLPSFPHALVPHVGWDLLESRVNIFADKSVYFTHSYFYDSHNYASDVAATFCHSDLTIPAIIKKNNIIGFQFHPEKSQDDGLAILQYCLSNSSLNQ